MRDAFAPRAISVTVRGVELSIRAPTAADAIAIREAETAEQRLFRAVACMVRDAATGAAIFESADDVAAADVQVVDELASHVARLLGGDDRADFPRAHD